MRKRCFVAALLTVTAMAGTAWAIDAGNRPFAAIVSGDSFMVYKVCDAGRAVYVSEGYGGYNRGNNAMAVIDNAKECQF